MSIRRRPNEGHISEAPDGTEQVKLANGRKIERHLETKMGDDGVEETHVTFGNRKPRRRATSTYDPKTRTFRRVL